MIAAALWIELLPFIPMAVILGSVVVWFVFHLRKARAPVSEKLLRGPGETLRAKLDDFPERLWLYCCVALLLGPICFLAFGYYVKFRAHSPHLLAEAIGWAIGVGLVTIAIALWMIRGIRDLANNSLGFRGERAVGEELNKLMLDGCLVYHDIPGDGSWNIDHVVVASSGVYAIETKTRRKMRRGKKKYEYEVVYDGKTLQYPNWTDIHGIDQAKANARWLAKHLSNVLQEEIKVTPILTLPGWMVTNRVKPTGTELRVLNHKQIRSVIVNGSAPVLDDKRLKQIGYQLELKCRDVEF